MVAVDDPVSAERGAATQGEAPLALEVRGLTKVYAGRRVVDRVSLALLPGRVHGLLGPNGAGKTTVLRLALGLVRRDAGDLRFFGERWAMFARGAPDGVAGSIDAPGFYRHLSGHQNLALLARLDLAEQDGGEAARLDQLLAEVGLSGAANVKVGAYSLGMRQRLAIASQILRRPRVLLLDEPTSSLDPAGARDVRVLLRRLADQGTAVLVSSHDMSEVDSLCDDVTVLRSGRVLFSGPLALLRDRAPAASYRLHTADDARAAVIGAEVGLELTTAPEAAGLLLRAAEADRDRLVLALGGRAVAVRSLSAVATSLESVFLQMTESPGDAPLPCVDAPQTATSDPARSSERRGSIRGVRAAFGAEVTKALALKQLWALLACCVVCPLAFVVALVSQNNLPEDTLFGRSARESGFAAPLVVLGFAATWAFPVLTSLLGGDIFASEDRQGTWASWLTRGCTRGELFAAKVMTALVFSSVAVTVLGASSVLAGAVVVGRQPLLGLSGSFIAPARALELVAASWASTLPAAFGFTSLAVCLSVVTRSAVAGVGLPVLVSVAMQIVSMADVPDPLRQALLTPPLVAWHGLLTTPPFFAPLAEGALTSLAYTAVCLAIARRVFTTRDVSG
jgi:ABC-2 type transport system ATP-binding protein